MTGPTSTAGRKLPFLILAGMQPNSQGGSPLSGKWSGSTSLANNSFAGTSRRQSWVRLPRRQFVSKPAKERVLVSFHRHGVGPGQNAMS